MIQKSLNCIVTIIQAFSYRAKSSTQVLKSELKQILNEDSTIAKQILKADRVNVINELSKFEISFPINFNNLIASSV